MKGIPTPMSAKKKTTVRPASPPEEKSAPTETLAAPRKATRSKKMVADVVSAAKKLFTPQTTAPKTEVTAETLVRRSYTRRKKNEVPAILSEGDQPAPPPVSGPGEKFSLGATPPTQTFPTAETELPEA